MDEVRHHGRRTVYRRFDRGGDGAPILCVHGSGATHAVWRGQARLADERPVLAIDLSGHGGSEDVATPAGPETLSAYAADVVAVASDGGATILCGNSLGAATALWIALESDLDLDAVVLAGAGASLGVRADLLGWLASDFDRAVDFLHGPNRLLAIDDSRYVEASVRSMHEVGQRVTERDFRTADAFDIHDRLAAIDVPALAVTGDRDALTPPKNHASLADRLPRGDWTLVDGAAHLSMLERPAAFNAAVGEFLAGHGV